MRNFSGPAGFFHEIRQAARGTCVANSLLLNALLDTAWRHAALVRFLHRGKTQEAIEMKRTLKVALASVGAALLLAPSSVFAHHSFVAEFNLNKPITVRGTLTKMEWVNPHGWIHIDVKGPDGKVTSWKMETGSPLRMEKRGLKKEDFKIGSDVIVSGYGSRDGSLSGAGMTITFADREASFPATESTFILGR